MLIVIFYFSYVKQKLQDVVNMRFQHGSTPHQI